MAAAAFLAANPNFPERWQRAIVQAIRFFRHRCKTQRVLAILKENNVLFPEGVDWARFLNDVPTYDTLSKSTLDRTIRFLSDSGIVPSSPQVIAGDVMVPAALTNG